MKFTKANQKQQLKLYSEVDKILNILVGFKSVQLNKIKKSINQGKIFVEKSWENE